MIKTIYIRKLRYSEAQSHFLVELERAFMSGEPEVEVIHGIGTYALRNMVLKEIKSIDYVEVIENHNPGSLRLRILGPEPSIMKKYLDV